MSGANDVNRSPSVSMLPPTDASPPKISEANIVIATATTNSAVSHTSWRYFLRQYQSRRRERTSCFCSSRSAPYSDGAGISRWARTSTRPRNAATPRIVPTIAHPSGHSSRS